LGPWHAQLGRGAGGLSEPSVAKCEQITTLPKDRLSPTPMGGPLSREPLARIRESLLRALDFGIQ
jgi:mRNA-degrading endonuclease toxin of MazEF toxin-antitoxin module